MINNDKIEIFNGIALLKEDQCICRFVRESGRLDHDQNMLPLVLEYIPIGGVVIDIGAFIGDHTIAYSNKVGNNGAVHAFEPSENAFECLSINSNNIGKFDNIYSYNCAIGKEQSMVTIETVADNNGMNYIKEGDSVNILPLDLCFGFDKYKIDFIKIDVEGYELDVLVGGKETINKFKPTMLIEINDMTLERQGVNRQQIFDWLTENNYIYRNIYKEQGLNDSQLDIICLPIN